MYVRLCFCLLVVYLLLMDIDYIFVFLLMCLMSVCDVIIQLKYFEQNFDCSYGYDN